MLNHRPQLGQNCTGERLPAESSLFKDGLGSLIGLLSSNIHISSPPFKIRLPQAFVEKIKEKVGPFWDVPKMQELLGAAMAALITTVLGWKETDVSVGYNGVDAIMKAQLGSTSLFAVVESKSGLSAYLSRTSSGRQMYDPWIRSRVQKALNGNLSAGDHAALNSVMNSGPLLATVIKTVLTTSSPYVAIKVQTYPGIGPGLAWGSPFEYKM